jgi:hypothetical protein
MNSYKQSLGILLAVALIAACTARVAANEANASPPLDFTLALGTPQRDAAERTLAALAEHAVGNDESRSLGRIFALDSPGAMRDTAIGYGFEIYLIDAASVLAGNSIDKSLRRTGVWRFLVLHGDRPIGLATVARVRGQWKTVQMGGAGLAADISDAVRDYLSDPSAPRLRFIRSEQGLADFIEVVAHGEPTYLPLLSAQQLALSSRSDSAAGASPATATKREALSEHRIIDALRASIQRGMNDPRFSH